MEVRYIPKEELRNWWTFVRIGLNKVLEKTPESWIPEDLYCDCYENRSMLWAALEYNRPIGFFVIQPNQTNIHVWVAYLEKPSLQHLQEGLEHIKGIARNGGCQTVTFSSFRKGWSKRARELGFSERTWICEV
jgi:hypothetical protein